MTAVPAKYLATLAREVQVGKRKLEEALYLAFCSGATNVDVTEQRTSEAQTITLPLAPNEDTEITCLYCRADRPCEYGLTMHRQGETSFVGLHASCLAPFRAMNPRQRTNVHGLDLDALEADIRASRPVVHEDVMTLIRIARGGRTEALGPSGTLTEIDEARNEVATVRRAYLHEKWRAEEAIGLLKAHGIGVGRLEEQAYKGPADPCRNDTQPVNLGNGLTKHGPQCPMMFGGNWCGCTPGERGAEGTSRRLEAQRPHNNTGAGGGDEKDAPVWFRELVDAAFALLRDVDGGELLDPGSQRLTDALAMIPVPWSDWGPEPCRPDALPTYVLDAMAEGMATHNRRWSRVLSIADVIDGELGEELVALAHAALGPKSGGSDDR